MSVHDRIEVFEILVNFLKMKKESLIYFKFLAVLFIALATDIASAQSGQSSKALDEKVRKFLTEHSHYWFDMNISATDGQLLYDLIIKGNYKSALEIGTSTGHSGIWIAWAISKTGGKLTTIEINEERYKTALMNFREVGLSEYIDARLADAHKLVRELKGPFDFIFSDADKGWYKNYFIDLDPKLIVGGCFTAHNISDRGPGRYRGYGGQGVFLEYVRSLDNYTTTVNNTGGGVSISYKKAER
jgi:predicted O-methyltransferase YrrM